MKKTLSLLFIIQLISIYSFATNYYCDPLNGSNSNDGLSPGTALWGFSTANSLLFNLVNTGDTIFLMEGDHGSVYIQNWIYDSAVTITNYDLDNPKLKRTSIINCKNVILNGLELQTLREAQYSDHVLKVIDCHNVTIQNCHIHSASSINDYTLYEDWWNNLSDGVQIRGGSNNEFYNNLLDYTMFAFVVFNSDSADVRSNEVSYFGGDGVRVVGSSYVNFINNYIHDNMSLMPNSQNPLYTDQWGIAQSTHQDLFQTFTYVDGIGAGQSTDRFNVYSNNIMISITDTTRIYKGMAQGMWMGDGFYENLTIENNLILSKTYNGIGLAGAIDCIVRNNTVLDPYNNIPYHPYSLPADQFDDLSPIWIILRKHNNTPNSGNEVYNNIVETINFYQEDFAGQYGTQNNNLILSGLDEYDDEFISPYNNPIALSNFSLLPSSQALDAGQTTVLFDILGHPRPQGSGFDIGCIEYETPIGINNSTTIDTFNINIINNELIIESNNSTEIEQIDMYDALGKIIISEETSHQLTYSKQLSEINNGVYIIVINNKYSSSIPIFGR